MGGETSAGASQSSINGQKSSRNLPFGYIGVDFKLSCPFTAMRSEDLIIKKYWDITLTKLLLEKPCFHTQKKHRAVHGHIFGIKDSMMIGS